MPFPVPIADQLRGHLATEYGAERVEGLLRAMETWPEVIVYRNLLTGHLTFARGVTLAEDEYRQLVLVAR